MKNTGKRPNFDGCLKKKYSKDNYGIINIRMTKDRVSDYFSTKEKLKCSNWDYKKNRVKEKYEDSERLNKLIQDRIDDLKKQYGITQSVELVKQNNNGSFLKYLNDEIEYLENVKRIGTSKRYRTTYYNLKKYLSSKNKSDLLFSDIDSTFVRSYESSLISQGIKNNTTKNYINCIKRLFNQSVRQNIFIPSVNPFIFYVNRKEPVEKKRLSKLDFEKIIELKLEKKDTLYNTKNFFLFQVFSQGLRVGDLLTLRFKNIIEGRIKFFQGKTKKPHTILINDNMMMILRDYIDVDTKKYLDMKWKFKTDSVEYTMTYDEMRTKYKEIVKDSLKGNLLSKGIPKEVINWKNHLDSVRFKIHGNLLIELHKFSKSNPDRFIFPILNPTDFKSVEFLGDTKLTKYQYNKISSKTTLYNKNLKNLQKLCGLNTNLSSHISRHTYTDLMLMGNTDVYDISKSLGHTKLATTEHYLKDFSEERVDDSNTKMNNQFSVV